MLLQKTSFLLASLLLWPGCGGAAQPTTPTTAGRLSTIASSDWREDPLPESMPPSRISRERWQAAQERPTVSFHEEHAWALVPSVPIVFATPRGWRQAQRPSAVSRESDSRADAQDSSGERQLQIVAANRGNALDLHRVCPSNASRDELVVIDGLEARLCNSVHSIPREGSADEERSVEVRSILFVHEHLVSAIIVSGPVGSLESAYSGIFASIRRLAIE